MFGGGLNLTRATLGIADGEALALMNYEINLSGNYQSLEGIERFDGQPAPSAVRLNPDDFESDEALLTELILQREDRRALIQPVPGSGPVRGVYFFYDQVIAFRDTNSGDALKMYRSSSAGWVEVPTPDLLPGGRFEFKEIHYAGRSRELVGVDGVNHGFIWDGEAFKQIVNPGMDETSDDCPIHVESLPSEILLFAYAGGSLQWSELGNPEGWDVVEGAGEAALASDITGVQSQAKDTTAVFCADRTYVIRGRVPNQWQVETLFSDAGAVEHSIQSVGDSIYLDAKGLTRLSRVQQFGDFDSLPLSQKVDPLMKAAIHDLDCTLISRAKHQYRIFLSSGAGVVATIVGGEVVGFSQFDYGRRMFCAASVNTKAGERMLCGGYDGFVYELDSGTSFDGDLIETLARLAYSSFSNQNQSLTGIKKRLSRAVLEIRAQSPIEAFFAPSFDYEDADIPESVEGQIALGEGAYWGGGNFDEASWSSSLVHRAHFPLVGIGETVSALIQTRSDVALPHALSTLSYRFIPLERRR